MTRDRLHARRTFRALRPLAILAVVSPALLAAADAAPVAGQGSSSFGAFFRLGFEHILHGYDHLMFLAGLLIVARSLRGIVAVVTAFTVAHSVTLACAAFALLAPPPRLVECAIAASIVWIGVENLCRRGEPAHRWIPAFVFGLVHGFGFAGVLREVARTNPELPVVRALLGFNLGVEAGQLAVVALVVPLLQLLRRRPRFVTIGERSVSGIVALAGIYWLVERVLSS